MRFKLVTLVLTGFALAACSSPSVDMSSSGGMGGSSSTGMMSDRVGGLGPGSSEDFTVNVGDRVFFALDRFQLSSEARDTLEKQSDWLRRYPDVVITIAGHTDERGTREYNLALGEKRASAVKNYLVALGVDPNRIKTLTYGKERPVDPRSYEEAWSRNRRGVTLLDGTTVSMSN